MQQHYDKETPALGAGLTIVSETKTNVSGRSAMIFEVEVPDPYADTDGNYDTITEEVKRLESLGYMGRVGVDLSRRRKEIDKTNPPTKQLIDSAPGVSEWLDLVPTAAALSYIYNPEQERLPGGTIPSAKMRAFLRNLSDGIGIRSRPAITRYIMERERIANPEAHLREVSLACGIAQPTTDYLHELAMSGVDSEMMPHFTIVDFQAQAIKEARRYARSQGVSEYITTRLRNIVSPEGIALEGFTDAVLRREPRKYDLVEAVGFLEYLKKGDRKPEYKRVMKKSRKPRTDAIGFMKNAYDLVAPGGIFMFGNMRDTHPQLEFTTNVIQWPHIQPRSISEMIQYTQEAGIDGEIEVYCPQDKVYAIYVIRKPD